MRKHSFYSLIVFFLFLIQSDHLKAQQANQFDISHRHHLPEMDSTENVSVEFWVDQIRSATKKYHDINIAELEGFVPFGPDMPNMGEHFVNPGLAVSRNFDPLTPSVLTYLNINGNMVLTGVAYTIPVHPGETPPGLLFPGAEWHYHKGNLVEESYGLHNHNMNLTNSNQMRLGMVHAWVWMENPDGFFVADNWSLNYNRLGIAPNNKPDPDASKALFLLFEGVDYYTKFTELAASPSEETLTNIRKQIQQTKLQVTEIVSHLAPGDKIHPEDEKMLAQLWREMWMLVKEMADTETWNNIVQHLHNMH
jgi:hypothetical protein